MPQNTNSVWLPSSLLVDLGNDGQLGFLTTILRDTHETILLTDATGSVLCLNASGEAALQYEQQQLVGQPITTLISAGDQAAVKSFYERNLEHDRIECVCHREDGVPFSARITLSKIAKDSQYVSVVIEKLTDESTASQQLVDSEAKYRLLVESAPVCIHEISLDGTLMSMNTAGLSMIESTPDSICGIPYLNFVDQESQSRVGALLKKAVAGESSEFQFAVDGPNGKLHFSSCFVPIRSDNGEVLRLMGITEDITDRLEAEEQKLKNEQQMLHAQKLESLGILSGGIAHDFNNLLMVIIGNVSMAIEDSKDPNILIFLEAIETTGARAADLCKQLLAYTGKGEFEVRATDLSRLIQDMHQILSISCSKNVSLRHVLSTGLPAVNADRTQLNQIVMNLVINASDAITTQSGVVTISTGVVEVDQAYRSTLLHFGSELTDGQYVFLEVTDTGKGISAETQLSMFDPFYTTKEAGRGLGLAATMGIVKAHGGAIKCYSELGKGTSIKILLPANTNSAAIETDLPSTSDGWQADGLALVVDDEKEVRDIAERMLQKIGFVVVTASNGIEALEIFKNRASEIELVLLDMVMPQLDGKATYEKLRQIDASVPVILSSGYNEYESTSLLTGKGLAGFIQKPYNLTVLRKKIQAVLTT